MTENLTTFEKRN